MVKKTQIYFNGYKTNKPTRLVYDFQMKYLYVLEHTGDFVQFMRNLIENVQKKLTVIGIFIFPNNHTNYSTLLLLQFGTIPTRLLSFSTQKVSGCLEPALYLQTSPFSITGIP